MTKNLFSAFGFRISLALLGCLGFIAFCVAPAVGLFFEPTRIPAVVTLITVVWAYHLMSRYTSVSTWTALFFPFSALVFVFALLRSMLFTLVQGGIIWRGTFYPLAELRKHTAPPL
jgi:hypothetical protein